MARFVIRDLSVLAPEAARSLQWRCAQAKNTQTMEKCALGCYHGVLARLNCLVLQPFQFAAENIMAKAHRGLDGRHRDKGGKIEKKHGNTRVGSLRKEYGASFAKGRRKDMMLKTLLVETGTASLHEYLRHHHK